MKHDHSERGGIYLLVLVTSGVAMSMGVLAVTAFAAQREVHELAIERERASQLAESAIHLALERIEADEAWRVAASGRVLPGTALGRGTVQVVASDDDGDLTDNADQSFTLEATADYGRATQRMAADFEIVSEAVEALSYPLVVAGGASGYGSLCVRYDSPSTEYCAGGLLEPGVSTMYAADSMNWIEQPDPSVVALYASRGSLIDVSASEDGAGIEYEELELSNSTAPDGMTPDPNGIYVIDGGGVDIRIERLSLIGTLVVVNANSVTIKEPGVMRPGPTGRPMFLTDAVLVLNSADSGSIHKTVPDDDDLDTGPDFDKSGFDGIQGLVYVDNNIVVSGDLDMYGSLIATGWLMLYGGDAEIRQRDAYTEAPPPGFTTITGVSQVTGSWRAVVD